MGTGRVGWKSHQDEVEDEPGGAEEEHEQGQQERHELQPSSTNLCTSTTTRMSHDSVVSAYTKLLTVDFRNVCVRTVKTVIREADRDVDAGHGDGAKPRCRRRGRRGRGPGPPLAVGGGDQEHTKSTRTNKAHGYT